MASSTEPVVPHENSNERLMRIQDEASLSKNRETNERKSWRKEEGSGGVLDAGLARPGSQDAQKRVSLSGKLTQQRLSANLAQVHPEPVGNSNNILDLANAGRAQALNAASPEGKDAFMIPPNAKFLKNWDPVVMGALIFTALVTPYEVALLETSFNALFVLNRLIDGIFVFDMALQFLVIQEVQTPDGTLVIKTRSGLARRYFRGWFSIDFVSIMPFDLIGFFSGSEEISKMKTIRLIRLARLLKLLRILRASRILARWQTRISVSFSAQKIVSCFTGLMVVSHWMACIWSLIGKTSEDSGEYSWLGVVADSKKEYDMGSAWNIYLVAAHISVTTIKATHGWGLPQNQAEYYLGILSQWIGGLVWTYVIGQFCGVFANLSPDKIRFQQNMDSLNRMMENKNMPTEMRYKLRGYFLQARELHMSNAYTGLLNQMSPKLQAEVAHRTHKKWLVKVWYLSECSDEFAAAVSQQMKANIFCPEETVSAKIPKLSIVSKGLVGRLGRVLRKGAVFGEDVILENPKLRKDVATLALTYAEILSIDQTNFLNLVKQASPHDAAEVRWGAVRLCVIRGVPVLADKLWKDKRLLESLLDRGFIDEPTAEDKAKSPATTQDNTGEVFCKQLQQVIEWKQKGFLSEIEFINAKKKLGLNDRIPSEMHSTENAADVAV